MAGKPSAAKAARQKRPSRILNTRKKTSTNSSNAASPLLSLPPEIRNRIYVYVLGGHDLHVNDLGGNNINRISVTICTATVDEASAAAIIRHGETSIDIASWRGRHDRCQTFFSRFDFNTSDDSKADTPPIRYSVPLLQSCSQVHREAALIPLQKNTFVFDGYSAFSAFAKQLMPIQKRAITTLSLSDQVFRSFRSGVMPALPGFKGFTGLKNIAVFSETERFIGGIVAEHSLVHKRDWLSEKLSTFKAVDLSSATVCMYVKEPGFGFARTHPARVNKFCEELENLLLENDDAQPTEANEEEA